MKTKLKFLVLIFAFVCMAVLLMPNQVWAAEDLVEVHTYETLREALESGKSVKLMNDIEITGNSVVKSSRSLGIAIMATKDLVVDGNGFSITSVAGKVRTAIEVYAGDESVNVTLKNITIKNSYSYGRTIDTRTGNLTLNLTKTILEEKGTGNPQVLTIGGSTGPVNVNINDSVIETSHAGYAIITFNPVNMVIKNSTVTGYSALYMREASSSLGSAGSVVDISDSTMTGLNNSNEPDKENPQNSFATIALADNDIELNVNNSELIAAGEGEAVQFVIGEHKDLSESGEPNKITISGNSVITAQEGIVALKNKNATVTLNKGVSANTEISADLLPSGMMVKKEKDAYVVSEIEVDFGVSQDKEENEQDFVVETVEDGKVRETLNASLKASSEVYQKAEEAIQNGENVNVQIEIEELNQETVKEEDKQKMLASISEDGDVHKYFDISILVKANDVEIGKLSELTDKVKLSMKLPKDLAKEGRKFYILRMHDGQVEKIEAVVNGESLEFETNKFSLYALAYEDVTEEKDDTPKTGTINILEYVFVALAAIALLGIIKTKKTSQYLK